MHVRQEIDELELAMVTGGASPVVKGKIDQSTKGNENVVNQNNVNGQNKLGIVQHNNVKGNSGNVKIGSPVHIDGSAGPVNLTIA